MFQAWGDTFCQQLQRAGMVWNIPVHFVGNISLFGATVIL